MLVICSCQVINAPDLDQENSSQHYASALIYQETELGQTFTSGFDGLLLAIEVKLRVNGTVTEPLLVDIRETTDGFPVTDNNNVIAAKSIPPSKITEDGWLYIDFRDFDIEVTQGDVLAIVLRSEAEPASGDEDPWYAWSTTGWSDHYARGIAVERYSWSGTNWLEGNDNPDIEEDRNFRTYIGLN